MAVSRIEEKILGRLARELPSSTANDLLSSSLYQLLGLSVQLSKRLYRARKLRKLDPTRDTKSLQLYHHIIWLAREGLAITEHNVVTRLRLDDYAPEYRVMAAKMQASLLHVLCLFDSTTQARQSDIIIGVDADILDSPAYKGPHQMDGFDQRQSTGGPENSVGQRHDHDRPFRDTIPSMVSDASYVTNPYAAALQTTPPLGFTSITGEHRRATPSRPPGLAPAGTISNLIANTSILDEPNKVPAARSYFKHVQHLADTLLAPTHALRLSVSLEHSAFIWECAKDQEQARRIAKSAIKEVYASPEGLDDEQFNDAAALVQALGGLVKRRSFSTASTPQSSRDHDATRSPPQQSQQQRNARKPPLAIDRTIALSPKHARTISMSAPNPGLTQTRIRTPERLSTVAEVESVDDVPLMPSPGTATKPKLTIPQPISHSKLPTRQSSLRSNSSTASSASKLAKRRIVEQAERRLEHQKTTSSLSSPSSKPARRSWDDFERDATVTARTSITRPHSRQATPPEKYMRNGVPALADSAATASESDIEMTDSIQSRTVPTPPPPDGLLPHPEEPDPAPIPSPAKTSPSGRGGLYRRSPIAMPPHPSSPRGKPASPRISIPRPSKIPPASATTTPTTTAKPPSPTKLTLPNPTKTKTTAPIRAFVDRKEAVRRALNIIGSSSVSSSSSTPSTTTSAAPNPPLYVFPRTNKVNSLGTSTISAIAGPAVIATAVGPGVSSPPIGKGGSGNVRRNQIPTSQAERIRGILGYV